MTLTVLTWLWAQPGGRTTFTATHVNIWAAMVRRHCTLDIEIACVTDMPEGIDPGIRIIAPPHEFEDIHLPSWTNGRPQCLRRLAMFRRDAADLFGERFACMDLDCVIGANIDRILGAPQDFRICRGTAAGRPYNGSIFLLTAGARPQAYERFSAEGAVAASARFVGSDQAWLMEALPGEATFGLDDGIMMFGGLRPKSGAIMFFPGQVKPWHAVNRNMDTFALAHYHADPGSRRVVYFGYGPHVWDDARDAFDPYPDMLIATHEAAELWPGPVDEMVRDDAHAIRLARMLGYQLVNCGAQADAPPALEHAF